MTSETSTKRFRIAFSFAGEKREGILHSSLKVVDTFDVNKKLTTSYRSH